MLSGVDIQIHSGKRLPLFTNFTHYNLSKHVLTEDIIHRSVDPEGKLLTKRLLTKTNSAPKWTERFLPSNIVYIVEESIVDIKNKTLITYTRNIGLRHLMCLEEKVVYKQCDSLNSQTVLEKHAWINSTFYGLSSAIQRFGLERYKQNIKKASKGFNYTLENMYGKFKSKNISTFNPMFTQKLKESASKASEFAKSNIPVVIADSQEKSA